MFSSEAVHERGAMRQFALFAFLILTSIAGEADVFKCKTPQGVVYSEHPCAENAAVVKNQIAAPTADDVKAAQVRALNENRQVQAILRQEEADRRAREAAEPRVAAVSIGSRTRTTTITTFTTSQASSQVPHSGTGQTMHDRRK